MIPQCPRLVRREFPDRPFTREELCCGLAKSVATSEIPGEFTAGILQDKEGGSAVVVVREAVLGDAPEIATVHVRSWQTTYPGIMPDEVLRSLSVERRTARWKEGLQNRPEGSVILVAEEDGKIVGFAAAGPERENDPVYHSELQAIYLLQEHQGHGAGRLLFCEVVRRLRSQGFTRMLLWVAAMNAPARAFYEKMGGMPLREKSVMMHGSPLLEVAYGYDLDKIPCRDML